MEYIYLFYGSRKGLKRITLGSSRNYLTVSNPHWKHSSFRIRINFKNQGYHLIYKYKYGKKNIALRTRDENSANKSNMVNLRNLATL